MSEKKKYFTVQELASLAGVSTSALRAWERRHDLFRPERSPVGHRLYTSDDLKLFWYVTHLRDEGWDLKKISALGRDELLAQALLYFSSQEDTSETFAALRASTAGGGSIDSPAPRSPADPHAASSTASSSSASPTAALHGGPMATPPPGQRLTPAQLGRRTYDIILGALANHDFETALGGLERLYTVTENNLEFTDACMELMVQVGDAWHAGLLSITAEHALTARVKHLLLGLLYLRGGTPRTGEAPRALCAMLPGELHELGLLRVAVYLREWGFQVTYVGSNTPIAALEEEVSASKPDMLCVSVTQAMNPAFLNQNLQKLAMAVGHKVTTVIGGSGVRVVSRGIPEMRMLTFCESMDDLSLVARRVIDGAHSVDQVLT